MSEFTKTIWTSAQGLLWGQKSKPVKYRKGSQDQYWGQLDLITNICNLKLGPKLTTLHTGAPTTRGQDWVSPTMEALAAGECQYCFDLYTFLVSDYILTSNVLTSSILVTDYFSTRRAAESSPQPGRKGRNTTVWRLFLSSRGETIDLTLLSYLAEKAGNWP